MLQLKTQLYRLKLDEYKVRKAALTELTSNILESLSTEYGVYLEDINQIRGHPWKILTALKQRIAPSDAAQIRDIETKYEKLKKGPGNQNLETYTEQWQRTYTDAINNKLFEAEGQRAHRHFLMAIREKETNFADTMLINLNREPAIDFYKLLEEFRQFVRYQKAEKGSPIPPFLLIPTSLPHLIRDLHSMVSDRLDHLAFAAKTMPSVIAGT